MQENATQTLVSGLAVFKVNGNQSPETFTRNEKRALRRTQKIREELRDSGINGRVDLQHLGGPDYRLRIFPYHDQDVYYILNTRVYMGGTRHPVLSVRRPGVHDTSDFVVSKGHPEDYLTHMLFAAVANSVSYEVWEQMRKNNPTIPTLESIDWDNGRYAGHNDGLIAGCELRMKSNALGTIQARAVRGIFTSLTQLTRSGAAGSNDGGVFAQFLRTSVETAFDGDTEAFLTEFRQRAMEEAARLTGIDADLRRRVTVSH